MCVDVMDLVFYIVETIVMHGMISLNSSLNLFLDISLTSMQFFVLIFVWGTFENKWFAFVFQYKLLITSTNLLLRDGALRQFVPSSRKAACTPIP
jgi:hypothetical protein